MRNKKSADNRTAKDFKGTIKRIFVELKDYHKMISVAIILAVLGAVLAIAAPDKLSNLTDEISKGLAIDDAKIEELSEQITKNTNGETITFEGVQITLADQQELIALVQALNGDEDRQELFEKLNHIPDSVKEALNPKMNMKVIEKITVTLIIMYLLSAAFTYIEGIIIAKASTSFSKSLRKKIINKTGRLPLNYFDSHATGDVLSRVTNDVDSISQAVGNSTTTLISSFVMVIGSATMMFYTNWLLAIAAIISSLIGLSLMVTIMGRSQKYFIRRQEELGNLNGYIEEIYSSLNVVKVYNGKNESSTKFNNFNQKLRDSNIKSQFLSSLMHPIMTFIGNLSFVVVCVLGAYLAMNAYITFGVIVAFTFYARLFTNPLSEIAQGMAQLQAVAAAGERVFEFLDEKEMEEEKNIKKKLAKKSVKGYVEFENVSFRYPANNKDTIIDFNAKAKPGQKIAIVGPTGAGKTTMVNLLMKFYKITAGDIKVDDYSINDLSRENVRDLFTMVLQDTWLFEGTVAENIIYNSKGIKEEQVKEVCESIGLDHFIKTLPNGYDTVLTEDESVSLGQKQLITIARGIIKDSPLLILDEATSNVDARTEELVQQAMDKLSEGKTSFIIAHRLSTIKNADLILVMKDGNIIEQGSHETLLAKEGFYNELYNSQFVL